ncbi:MAG: glycosyltransferase family 4 protein [Candidatus Electryoneaceae bacterium]|nr:glycosyltransferase family 4 protein [Candidatus Electryoneaceae bacterium]
MHVIQVPRRFVRSDWGGTETVILETAKRLLMTGHQTMVLCPNALADRNREIIEGVPVRRTSYFYPYWWLGSKARKQLDKKGGNLFSFSLMMELKLHFDLDIIHLHTMKRLGGIGRRVAIKKRIPYVVSLHGGAFDVPAEERATWTAPTKGSFEWGKILGAWVGSRRVLDDAAAIICVGQQEQIETQKRYPDKKVIHLANGVDPERFQNGDGSDFRWRQGIHEDAYVILVMGRIDVQKNQLFAVRMMHQLLKEIPNAHLLLIGHVTNDAYYQKVLNLVRNQGLENNVTVIGGLDAHGDDLINAYHAADMFLLSSIHEPFGIVILEAWAAGLPVVASKVGGVPSFVEDGKDGMLFESNDEQSLMKAVFTVAKNHDFADQLADAGRKKAHWQYSWQQITGQLVNIYESAIDENPLRK